MQASRAMIVAGIIAAAAVGFAVTTNLAPPAPAGEESKPATNFPIRIDFARVLPYDNATDPTLITRGYVMNARLLYPEEGPPRPFHLLLLRQGESWDDLTTPEEWVKGKYHGFEVLSSSSRFDMFTEYYPFDSALIPLEMRLYCGGCDEKWSDPEAVRQGADTKATKIRALSVKDGDEFYRIAFALGNDQIDTLPASGTVEFRLTDSVGVTLFETNFQVKKTDFTKADVPIKLLRIPLGGKAFYQFAIPTEQIMPSPSGSREGFAFLNFLLEDKRILSGGIRGINLPPQ